MRYLLFVFPVFILSYSISAADLVKKNGKTYKNYKVLKVKSTGLQIIHSTGIAFIKFIDLPEAIQKEYNFDEKAYLKKIANAKKEQLKQREKLRKQAIKRKADYEKAKLRDLERQKLLKEKLKREVRAKGSLACFISRELFELNGRRKLRHFPDIDRTCIVYKNYMLYQGEVYLAKNNIISAEERLKQLEEDIKKQKSSITKLLKKLGLSQARLEESRSRVITRKDYVIDDTASQQAGHTVYTLSNEAQLFLAGKKRYERFRKTAIKDNKKKLTLKMKLLNDTQKKCDLISDSMDACEARKKHASK